MQKRHKDLMRTLVTELRHILVGSIAPDGTSIRGDLDRELERLGISPDGTIIPLDAMANPALHEQQAHRMAVAQLVYCDEPKRASMRMEIVERAAYSWINRLLALRAMEARGLIEETMRVNPEYDGLPEALYILRQSEPSRTSGADGGRWAVLEDACQTQTRSLPGLFSLDDPATALRPSIPALIRSMALVGGSMPGFTLAELDAAFADPDAIGWAYQFYQEEAKARIYTKLGSGGKASTRSEIAAATELFTEPYMVKWLLQNSLGRSYHEIYPDSAMPDTWEYYIKPDTLDTSTTFNLVSLTILDPCMGSGHFLREAFDMFVAMYREQFHTFTATGIADRILSHHLHGIDLDPRAAQLSALTLYLRAWELVRDERQKEHKSDPGTYTPPAMNLATTPTSLNEGALQRHLLRYPQDLPLKPLLEGVFSGLEQADILGSLLRPKEYLDNAITQLQKMYNIPLDPEEAEMRRTISELANRDPLGLRLMLLERVADSFKAEAGNTDDVSAALFGREAEQGVRLLQLLDRRYAVVVTNPPYMDSKNFDTQLKKYIEKYYMFGKRDLYAAFILRCLELCLSNGRIAMVTQQSWMFLQSYTSLRAMPNEKLVGTSKKEGFTGLQREVRIEVLAHLGEYAFEEPSAAGAFAVMYTINNRKPELEHRLIAIRLVGLKTAKDKALLLQTPTLLSANTYRPVQRMFTLIPKSPMPYYLSESFLEILNSARHLSDFATTIEGLNTTDNSRFLHYSWEVLGLSDWQQYSKGGGYKKWFGNEELTVRWATNGNRLMSYIEQKYKMHWSKRVSGILFYNEEGWVYSLLTRGSLGCRQKNLTTIFDVHSVGIFPLEGNETIIALINSRVASYILRSIISNLMFHAGYVADLPIILLPDGSCLETIKISIVLKKYLRIKQHYGS